MNDYGAERFRTWRSDQGAMLSGVCAGLAEDLDLPLPLIRVIAMVFLVLPTGLAYLALSLLLRRRVRAPAPLHAASPSSTRRSGPAAPRRPTPQNFALLAHRFEALEPRLKRIEAYVTSSEFELNGGFRRMGE